MWDYSFEELMDERKELILAVIGLAALIIFLHFTGYLDTLLRLFADIDYLQETVEEYKTFGVFILLGLQLLNIVFAPIPGQALGVAYGLIYGVWWGTFFAMVGTAIGTAIVVIISKRYGRPFVRRAVGEESFQKYEDITDSTDVWPFIVLMTLPLVPDDVLVYLGGLTNIETKRLIFWLIIARIPGTLSLTWFGGGIAAANYFHLGIITALILIGTVYVILRREKIMEKYVKNNR